MLERFPEMPVDQMPVPRQQQVQMQELVLRMEDIVYRGGIPRFDRVRLVTAEHALWFIWDEGELAIAVDLDDNPEAAEEAFKRATASAGDAVLN